MPKTAFTPAPAEGGPEAQAVGGHHPVGGDRVPKFRPGHGRRLEEEHGERQEDHQPQIEDREPHGKPEPRQRVPSSHPNPIKTEKNLHHQDTRHQGTEKPERQKPDKIKKKPSPPRHQDRKQLKNRSQISE